MGAAENGRLECLEHLIAIHIEKKANLNAQVPACSLGYRVVGWKANLNAQVPACSR